MLRYCRKRLHVIGYEDGWVSFLLTKDGRCWRCRAASHNRANARYRARTKGILAEQRQSNRRWHGPKD